MTAEARVASDLLVAAIEAIYDSAGRPSNWQRALKTVANVFGDVGVNLIWGRDNGSFGVIGSPRLLSSAELRDTWQHADIRSLRAFERSFFTSQDALVVTDHHLLTRQEIAEHPFYTKFLAPRGLCWVAGAMVFLDPLIELSINRARTKPPFSDEELRTLAHLARHAEQSLRLSMRLFDAELSKLGLGEALARVGMGVFLLDSLKRVVFANRATERLLGDGLVVAKDRVLQAAANAEALYAAIERMICAAPNDATSVPKPILIPRQKSQRPLILYVLPITAHGLHHAASHFLTHARATVLVIDPQGDAPADPALVREIFGLTLGEARVAALVGFGLTPRAAAQKLGIAEGTARMVLKRVFAKAGVSRQSELSALLTRLILR